MKLPGIHRETILAFKPRVQRAAYGALLKKRYAQNLLLAYHVSLSMVEASKNFETFPDVSYAMTRSDLWKLLTSLYGKCDGMVPGKCRKARVFCFETESLYIWCDSESGDQGTRWLFIENNMLDTKNVARNYTYLSSIFRNNPHLKTEIVNFFQNLLLDMAQACATNRAELVKLGAESWTPFLNMQAQEEALNISQEVLPPTHSVAKLRI